VLLADSDYYYFKTPLINAKLLAGMLNILIGILLVGDVAACQGEESSARRIRKAYV
jgi:hypothetical protein